jgi:hypothetical protein
MGDAGFTRSRSTMPPMPGIDGGDAVGIDGEGLRLEVGTDPLLAAERDQCRLAEVFLLGHALLLTPLSSAELTDIKPEPDRRS